MIENVPSSRYKPPSQDTQIKPVYFTHISASFVTRKCFAWKKKTRGGAADAGRALGLRVPATRPESRSWVRGRESHSCLPLEERRGPPSRGLAPKNRATKPSNFPFWLVPFACPLSDWGGLRRKMSFIYGGAVSPSVWHPLTGLSPTPYLFLHTGLSFPYCGLNQFLIYLQRIENTFGNGSE